MNINQFKNIEIISDSKIYEEKNSGTVHTAYETEVIFYSCIKSGNAEETKRMMSLLLSDRIVTGKLSDDKIRQIKYWAVCCVTLATRYAIAGGLDENEAFNFSDRAIMAVDKMQNCDEIYEFLSQSCISLTKLVARSREKHLPKHIRKCIHYINANLNEKLSAEILAKECSLSPDYLSSLFKKSTGQTLSAYILNERLEKARQLLLEGNKSSDVAYYLGFCSESYFIKCFREKFKVTPKKYALS